MCEKRSKKLHKNLTEQIVILQADVVGKEIDKKAGEIKPINCDEFISSDWVLYNDCLEVLQD